MEVWDLYDENKELINGVSHIRYSSVPIPRGMYHIAVCTYIITKNGKALITQRSKNKSKPLMWEASGGSVLQGEQSIDACVRELKEETSIEISKEKLKYLNEERGDDWILECYYAVVDNLNLDSLVLQDSKVADAKLVDLDELYIMNEAGYLLGGVYENFHRLLKS